jgi:hypothetical protein
VLELRLARFASFAPRAALGAWIGLASSSATAALALEARLAPAQFASLGSALDHAKDAWLARSLARDREVLGGIFASLEAPLRFVYSAALGARGADEIRVRLRVPAGFRLAAIWHTHGAEGLGRAWFSARDVEVAELTRVPVYLLTPAGDARVFRPGDVIASAREARAAGLGWTEGLARGSEVELRGGEADAELVRTARAAVERCARSPS